MGKFAKVAAAASSVPGALQSYLFDRWFGVSISVDSILGLYGENNGYGGSHWFPVRRALRKLKPGPKDVFVDLGSGKGIVLLIAGRLPFGRVIGVDIDEELDRSAKENISQAVGKLRAAEVTSVAESVLDWPVPDDLSVVFMFNPFTGDTFRTAMTRILESYDRGPRDLRIIYGFPAEHDWLVRTGRVVVESVSKSYWLSPPGWWRKGHVLVTYRVVPPGEGGLARSASGTSSRRNRAFQHWSGPNGFRLVAKKSDDGEYHLSASYEPRA